MRVTGGVLRGRRILTLKGAKVRPTQDRVRLALFSSLAPRMPACRFLDLFAGSGAVGLEAWSRGAAAVWWVEREARVVTVLRRNVETLCGTANGERCRIIRGDAVGLLEKNALGWHFDIVFADPPYDRGGQRDWIGRVLRAIGRTTLLEPGGLVVAEQAADEPEAACPGWRNVGRKIYGGTRLSLWERCPGDGAASVAKSNGGAS